FQRYGGKTIVLARFAPILRTYAPFVAGAGRMTYAHFATYNLLGGVLWVSIFLLGGYFFGNIPVVPENFGLVVIAIVVLSLVPAVVEFLRHRKAPERGA
ncbi:MAG TPA: VTT domain-containing protein, partial [Longimicrobiaceae bacterium]|nr:VTT domain-containing protein [Longimicrobiaceae bacterium]